MDNEFIAYLQKLEILGFFSGYPLLYHLIYSISGGKNIGKKFKERMIYALPATYAIAATLYLGLQLRNLYPDISFDHFKTEVYIPILMFFGILAIVFWLPYFRKKTFISVLHGWVFFILLLKDIAIQLFKSYEDKDVIKNNMKVYFDSILLNLVIYSLLIISIYFYSQMKKNKAPNS